MSINHGSERGHARAGCVDRKSHRPHWVVTVRKANYSAFNGGRRTPSDYSEVRCPKCSGVWRTKAAYVDDLPDEERTYSIPLSELNGQGLARTIRKAREQR